MATYIGRGNGSSGTGSLSGTSTLVDSVCSGSSGTTALTATNASFSAGQMILIHQSRGGANVGKWEFNKIASYVAGTITTEIPLTYTYTNSGNEKAQVIVCNQYTDVNVASTLTVKAWDGSVGGILPIVATGKVTITAKIDGSGPDGVFVGPADSPGSNTSRTPRMGFGGGEVGELPGESIGYQGEGTSGDRTTQSTSANGNGGGGGQATADQSASGGGGGNGTAGSNGSTTGGSAVGGTGGSTAGSEDLTTIVFGGAGGGACGKGGTEQGTGGTGGAIVIIVAKELEISGSGEIDLDGGVGGSDGGSSAIDGGSGAGGSFLGIVQTATIASNKIHANGGSATGGGGTGGAGRIRLNVCSYSGNTSPSASVQEGGHSHCAILGGLL